MTKLLMLVALLFSGTQAKAYTLLSAHWGEGTVPFYLNLGTFNNVAARELADWDQYTGNTRLTTTSNSAVNGRPWFMDGRNTIEWSSDVGWTLPGNILGVCSFYSLNGQGNNDGVMREADVLINRDFTWSSYDGFSGTGFDIGRVLLHEIGHAIGLDHSNADAIMNPYYNAGRWTLSADDIAGAEFIYGPRTTTGGGSTVPDTGSTLAFLGLALTVLLFGKGYEKGRN